MATGTVWSTPPDASTTTRDFDQGQLEEFRSKRQFDYGKEPLPEMDELPDFSRKEQNINIPMIMRFLMYAVIIAILSVLIYFIAKHSIARQSSVLEIDDIPEMKTGDIREMKFDDLIGKALDNGQYRIAVRLLYLETLKMLTNRGFIDWKPHKTNQEYQYEMMRTSLGSHFDRLTLSYEYIWYGNFPIDQEGYDYVDGVFKHFQSFVQGQK